MAYQEDGNAYCLLDQMFEESVCHAKACGEYPPGSIYIAKIYYELAANQGNGNGMYYLGCACFDEKNFEQSEKWLTKAADNGIETAYYRLGELYHILWRNEKKQQHLERAFYWKNKSLEKNAHAFSYKDMGDFCKDIITEYENKNEEEKRKLFSDMKNFYLRAIELAVVLQRKIGILAIVTISHTFFFY